MMTLAKTGIDDKKLTQWAHYKLFGVDRDKTNVKLTRALIDEFNDRQKLCVYQKFLFLKNKTKEHEKALKKFRGE